MNEQSESNPLKQVVNVPGGAIAGATYPLRAFVFLSQTPSLWGCVIMPVIVNVILGALLSAGLLLPGWRWIDQWAAGVPAALEQGINQVPFGLGRWLTWLPSLGTTVDDVLRVLLTIVLLLFTGLLLVQFGAILGAPWYGNLAEQIERHRMGQLPTAAPNLGRALQDIGRAITFQIKKLMLLVAIGLPLLVLGFIPVVGSIASFAELTLFALLVGLDFLDPPLERRRLGFRAKLGVMSRTFPASLSFSFACLGLVSIPLLNLLAVPLCITAGTLYCCDRVLPNLAAAKSGS
jgi:CysZ protein